MNSENLTQRMNDGSITISNKESPIRDLSRQLQILNLGQDDNTKNKNHNFLTLPLMSIENLNSEPKTSPSNVIAPNFPSKFDYSKENDDLNSDEVSRTISKMSEKYLNNSSDFTFLNTKAQFSDGKSPSTSIGNLMLNTTDDLTNYIDNFSSKSSKFEGCPTNENAINDMVDNLSATNLSNNFCNWENPFLDYFNTNKKSTTSVSEEPCQEDNVPLIETNSELNVQTTTCVEETISGQLMLRIATPYKIKVVPVRGLNSEDSDFTKKRDLLMRSDKKLSKKDDSSNKLRTKLLFSKTDDVSSVNTDSECEVLPREIPSVENDALPETNNIHGFLPNKNESINIQWEEDDFVDISESLKKDLDIPQTRFARSQNEVKFEEVKCNFKNVQNVDNNDQNMNVNTNSNSNVRKQVKFALENLIVNVENKIHSEATDEITVENCFITSRSVSSQEASCYEDGIQKLENDSFKKTQDTEETQNVTEFDQASNEELQLDSTSKMEEKTTHFAEIIEDKDNSDDDIVSNSNLSLDNDSYDNFESVNSSFADLAEGTFVIDDDKRCTEHITSKNSFEQKKTFITTDSCVESIENFTSKVSLEKESNCHVQNNTQQTGSSTFKKAMEIEIACHLQTDNHETVNLSKNADHEKPSTPCSFEEKIENCEEPVQSSTGKNIGSFSVAEVGGSQDNKTNDTNTLENTDRKFTNKVEEEDLREFVNDVDSDLYHSLSNEIENDDGSAEQVNFVCTKTILEEFLREKNKLNESLIEEWKQNVMDSYNESNNANKPVEELCRYSNSPSTVALPCLPNLTGEENSERQRTVSMMNTTESLDEYVSYDEPIKESTDLVDEIKELRTNIITECETEEHEITDKFSSRLQNEGKATDQEIIISAPQESDLHIFVQQINETTTLQENASQELFQRFNETVVISATQESESQVFEEEINEMNILQKTSMINAFKDEEHTVIGEFCTMPVKNKSTSIENLSDDPPQNINESVVISIQESKIFEEKINETSILQNTSVENASASTEMISECEITDNSLNKSIQNEDNLYDDPSQNFNETVVISATQESVLKVFEEEINETKSTINVDVSPNTTTECEVKEHTVNDELFTESVQKEGIMEDLSDDPPQNKSINKTVVISAPQESDLHVFEGKVNKTTILEDTSTVSVDVSPNTTTECEAKEHTVIDESFTKSVQNDGAMMENLTDEPAQMVNETVITSVSQEFNVQIFEEKINETIIPQKTSLTITDVSTNRIFECEVKEHIVIDEFFTESVKNEGTIVKNSSHEPAQMINGTIVILAQQESDTQVFEEEINEKNTLTDISASITLECEIKEHAVMDKLCTESVESDGTIMTNSSHELFQRVNETVVISESQEPNLQAIEEEINGINTSQKTSTISLNVSIQEFPSNKTAPSLPDVFHNIRSTIDGELIYEDKNVNEDVNVPKLDSFATLIENLNLSRNVASTGDKEVAIMDWSVHETPKRSSSSSREEEKDTVLTTNPVNMTAEKYSSVHSSDMPASADTPNRLQEIYTVDKSSANVHQKLFNVAQADLQTNVNPLTNNDFINVNEQILKDNCSSERQQHSMNLINTPVQNGTDAKTPVVPKNITQSTSVARLRENLDKLLTPFRESINRFCTPVRKGCSSEWSNLTVPSLISCEKSENPERTRFVVEVPTNLLDISVTALDNILAKPTEVNDSAVVNSDPNINMIQRNNDLEEEQQDKEIRCNLAKENENLKCTCANLYANEKELKEENENLKFMCASLYANEKELKEVLQEAEDKIRILNNRYEMLKDYANKFICQLNEERQALEDQLRTAEQNNRVE